MIALQMLVGLVFIFMGVTRLADKFVHAVPNSVKGGILLAAPVTVMAGQLGENGNMHKYPLAIVAGVGLLILISFSDKYQEKRKTNKFLDLVARYGNLFPYLIAMVVSFFRPIFGVGSSITLMFQAFVCARIGMDYCKTDRDKMIAGVMAAVLATQGTAWASAWALAVGFGLNVFLSNWNPLEKK